MAKHSHGHTHYVPTMCSDATSTKKWLMAQHETHHKNNITQFTNYQHEQMKACMLEVHMAITWKPIFAKKKAFDYGINGVCRGGTYSSS